MQPSASPEAPVASASPTASGLPLETVGATTVEELAVRRNPGTGGERIGFLPLGTIAFVLEGPTDVDDVPWYLVTAMGCATWPPDELLISCPGFVGWVAGANAAGEPWLAATDPGDCPDPTIESISEWGSTWRLVCWADEPVTFDAWWPDIPPDADPGVVCPEADRPGGFLYCQHINHKGLSASPTEGWTRRLSLSIDPASGVEMPAGGQWRRVTGRFDHEAAEACGDLVVGDTSRDPVIMYCRVQSVPSSVEALSS